MNILVAAAWMWMAAQSGNMQVKSWTPVPPSRCHALELGCTPRLPVMQDAEPVNPPAPAEHVIEIRTKRGLPDAECIARVKSIVPEWTPEVASVALKSCTHKTREIWIDGKKWGVLKETEQ